MIFYKNLIVILIYNLKVACRLNIEQYALLYNLLQLLIQLLLYYLQLSQLYSHNQILFHHKLQEILFLYMEMLKIIKS